MVLAEPLSQTGELLLCKRCNAETATTRIRLESVCKKCFSQYVITKVVKRMETYRIRGSTVKIPKRLLLPLSFGPSSASLLLILDQHLQSQYDRMGRASYELFVAHIDMHVEEEDRASTTEKLQEYTARFPRHTYVTTGLENALHLDGIDWTVLGLSAYPFSSTKSAVAEDSALDIKTLQELLAPLKSATSRADIIATLLTRLLVDVARKHGCETILFGDTTTRLAERTLLETAKGRGFSLPWQVSDGVSPYGIIFNYPSRDVLKKEIVAFSSLIDPPLSNLILPQEPLSHSSAPSKTASIDSLLAQYFDSVEENYPNIVANVVRTTSKLTPLRESDTQECRLCGLPVAPGTHGIFGWGGDQTAVLPAVDASRPEVILCYGCSRTIND